MRFQSLRTRLLPVALASALCPSAALASDGVIEINQAKVMASGGFPFKISQPGSYRLAGNLSVSGDFNAIEINTAMDSVSLDLNGFEIAGPVLCSGLTGSALTCGPGSGTGILGGFGGHVSLRHGTVRGFGKNGVSLTGPAWIEDLQVTSNGSDGILASDGSLVENSKANQNGGVGIRGGSDSVIQKCVAQGNHSGGIVTSGSVVVGNAVSNNGTFGINASNGSVIRDNQASTNQGAGIASTVASMISHNSADSNQFDGIDAGSDALVSDNLASSNKGAGINADARSSVQRNTTTGNSVDGLYLVPTTAGAPPAAYRANVMSANGIFPVASGVNLGANACNGAGC